MENREVKLIDRPLLTVGIAKRIVLSYEKLNRIFHILTSSAEVKEREICVRRVS
jgi:hypothetical protein